MIRKQPPILIRVTKVKPGAAILAFLLISGCGLAHKSAPYKDPDRLVSVVKVAPAGEDPVLDTDFLEWRIESKTLGPIAAYVYRGVSLTGGSEPERVHTAAVSADFFPTLGVQPILGRVLLPVENRSGGHPVAVVSYNLWQRRFGADPSMIGRNITLDQKRHTVVGVMQVDFKFPKDCDIWSPLAFDAEGLRLEDKSSDLGLDVIARLKPGVELEQAQAEMSLIARKLEKENPQTNHGRDVKLIALREGRAQKENKVEIKLREPAK